MGFVPNPNLPTELSTHLRRVTSVAAEAASDQLAQNLGSSTHGTGRHYDQNPYRSSAPGQYPVKQRGELQAGVGFDPNALPDGAQVFIQDDYDKLIDLEFAPPSQNPNLPPSEPHSSGGRAPMWRTMNSQETQDRMRQAIESIT